MLDPMQRDWRVGPVGHGYDGLEAQEVIAAHRRQPVEPGRQGGPGDRSVAGDAESANAVVVPVYVRVMVVVLMPSARAEGFVTQPALYVPALRDRIAEADVVQPPRVGCALCDGDDWSARVERL